MEIDKVLKDFNFINSREGRAIRILTEFSEAKSRLEKLKINNTIVMFGSARIKDKATTTHMLDIAKKSNLTDTTSIENKDYIANYYEKTRELSFKLATWSKNMYANSAKPEDKFYICTGGGGGIMEAGNRGAFEAGEKSLGFNITLPFEQNANPYLDPAYTFDFQYFFLRKFWFSYLAKAFVVFPGGFGTLDELFEVLTLIQTHKMKKKLPIVLFGKEFFTSVFLGK